VPDEALPGPFKEAIERRGCRISGHTENHLGSSRVVFFMPHRAKKYYKSLIINKWRLIYYKGVGTDRKVDSTNQ
jgi:hypothetical protein